MSIKNPKLFGLNVLSSFADVENKNISLQNINLPPLDLEVILGSSDAGATRNDWISFSRLVDPLYKTLDRLFRDSNTFSGLLNERAGTDGSLFGNLKINGSLSGNAIRYRYVDGTGGSATIKIADISTSRTSAWSSAASPVLSTSPISYGARLGIRSGGALKFGTATGTGPRLQTSIVPQAKEFPSEFPTHKIQTSIGGQTVTLYAMKGIPVVFKGFFRNLNATIRLTDLISDTPASWKIIETGNANRYSSFKNQGNTTSTIRYRSSISRERFIQFYYNPDKISQIIITSANIRSLPAVKFQSASRIDLSYNGLREFPILTTNNTPSGTTGIAENLNILLLRRNPFYLSEFENERKLQNSTYDGSLTFNDGSVRTDTILDKIPSTLTQLYLEGTFYGSITQNIFADRFPSLTVFDFGRRGGAYFHPDSAGSAVLPNVASTVETYSAARNDFRSIGSSNISEGQYSINDLQGLISLSLSSNYYLSGLITIPSTNNVIKDISISATGLQFPAGLSGKNSLVTFSATYGRNVGKLIDKENGIDYRFDGCGALTSIRLYRASLSKSRFPIFTNPSLITLDLRYTNIRGGGYDGNTPNDSYVIPRETFQFTTELANIYIDSGSLLTSSIHPDALVDITALYYFWYRSYGRTGGLLPNFGGNPNLGVLRLFQNAFTGSVPNLAANQNIRYVEFNNNKFTNAIPTYRNLSKLTNLYLHNNQLTGIGKFENLPVLKYLYMHNNQISGQIPDFSECPRLYYLIMYNNNFTGYKTGAFKELYRIRYIDLSDNNLTGQAIDQLLEDLYDNWVSVNRGGVTVNLRGNGEPSVDSLDFITLLRSKGWNITHD
jgi:hypothetical protein